MEDLQLWHANKDEIKDSHLTKFANWVKKKQGIHIDDYHDLWKWSTDYNEEFWESVIWFYDIQYSGDYRNVISGKAMPNIKWFEGIQINYCEHIFRTRDPKAYALIFRNEYNHERKYTWSELEKEVASFQKYLLSLGMKKGDRCVAYLPNIPEALIAFLACSSLGIIWSSCSPDFGVNSVIDRFAQIEPTLFISIDGYRYGGKTFNREGESREIRKRLPTVTTHLHLDYLDGKNEEWHSLLNKHESFTIKYVRVDFSDPIWVLYSSGTTGIPKAITHSQGGILLEHIKYLHLQNDVHEGEVYFWYSTTGWMMWNFANSALLAGATVFIYDGSPTYPEFDVLWKYAEEYKINHFGTSAPYLVACMKREISPKSDYDLSSLRSIGSTGAPLPPEAFDYVYNSISENVWLCSMAGGTDVCTAFVGSYIWGPVLKGKIQGRGLGVSLFAFNESGEIVKGEVGEMVITKPMPSMPIYFWNDPGNKRYHSSYFESYPDKWRHGDWISIDKNGMLIIYGRSDATLNRHGIRIGTSEIYRSINKIDEIEDSLIVNLELEGGSHFMPLFVKMKSGEILNQEITDKIKKQLRSDYSPRHVPDAIMEVPDIPYTLSGKKLETPIKKILLGMPITQAANEEATKNPEAIYYFQQNRESILKQRFK
jgi:acetoacetyl-CoA synthetase